MKLSFMLSASITVYCYVYTVYMCGRNIRAYMWMIEKILLRINHCRTSGGVRMYLGFSGLDYTSSRWVWIGFREFYNRDTWEFLVNAPRLFAFDTGKRVESRFNRRRHSDRHGVNLTRYAPPSTSSCFYCTFALVRCSR